MRKLIAGLAMASAVLWAAQADADTGYMLNFTQWNPYQRYSVAGPFETLNECMAVKSQQTYSSRGAYSCDVFSY